MSAVFYGSMTPECSFVFEANLRIEKEHVKHRIEKGHVNQVCILVNYSEYWYTNLQILK